MKFLKADGTVEDGTPLTDEQVADKERVEALIHDLVCHNGTHYGWQGMAKCVKVSIAVAQGGTLLAAMEDLKPKPEPIPVPQPAPVVEAEQPPVPAVEEDELAF